MFETSLLGCEFGETEVHNQQGTQSALETPEVYI